MRSFSLLTGLGLVIFSLSTAGGLQAEQLADSELDRFHETVSALSGDAWIGPMTEKGGVIEPDG